MVDFVNCEKSELVGEKYCINFFPRKRIISLIMALGVIWVCVRAVGAKNLSRIYLLKTTEHIPVVEKKKPVLLDNLRFKV